MNADLRHKWTEALRSGEYPQGTGALKTQSGYCCLGVAAAACFPDRVIELSPYSITVKDANGNPSGFTGCLPVDVSQELGISASQHSDLISLNDTGYPFNFIADRIDQWEAEDNIV
jgi:hypothetical protein